MAIGLLDLPPEVQRTVFRQLKYPSLTKLRNTCRQLRAHVPLDIVQESLQTLESEWGEAELLSLEQTNKGAGVNNRTILNSWGYEWNEALNIRSCLPCYGCLKLLQPDQFFHSMTLEDVAKYASILGRSYQKAVEPAPTRQCMDCVLQSSEYHDTPGGRWRYATHVPSLFQQPQLFSQQPQWFAICRACNYRVQEQGPPLQRQRRSDLCSACYEQVHPRWFQIRREIERKQDEIRQLKAELERQDQVLTEYSRWMYGVDRGESVLKNIPQDLEGVEVSDWSEVRPDAVAKLRLEWEMTR